VIIEGGTAMTRVLLAGGLALGLTLLAAPGEAQMGGARGKVVDAEGQPVADATILFESRGGVARKYEAKTNDKGEYIRIGMMRGPYRITATKDGYQAVAMERNIDMGEPTDLPLMTLEPLDRSSTIDPSAAEELKEKYSRAVELTRGGRFDEAEALYKEILETLPGLAPVHQNLGYIYAQREDWPNAEKHYLEALELNPEEPAIKHGLIKVYQGSGQDEKALALVNQMAEEHPEDATAQYNRALFLNDAGKTEEAAKAFEAALAADPAMAEALYELARILLLQSKGPEAIEHLEAYLAANPTNEQNKATAEGLLEALKKK
jgi:tetratricopeptide (TPR) repeat protein